MPRAFREDERARIEARLLEIGRALFERQGLRRTNVAELARAAGIGKGSFYLFFATKEDLFMAISDRFQAEVKAAFVRELELLRRSGADARALVRRYFELHFEVFERNPLLALITDPAELEALVRKVGPERFIAERDSDAAFFTELIEAWQADGLIDASVDATAVAALSRGILALIQGRELVGEDDWGSMVELLIDALAERLASKDPRGRPAPCRSGTGFAGPRD